MKAAARRTSAAPRVAAAVPSVDLRLFCLPNPKLPALEQPWNYGEHTYATDSRVMVRVPVRAEFATDPLSLGTGAAAFFCEHPIPGSKALSALPLLPRLKGMHLRCPDCHGSGAVLNPKRQPVLCSFCAGERQVLNKTSVDLGTRRFAAHYLARVATLPSLRIALACRTSSAPLRFAFDGGQGLLMPLQK